MKTKHEVIDNFLSKEDFERLKNIAMNSLTSYFFQSDVNDNHKDEDLSIYFTHSLFNQKDDAIYSNLYHNFSHIFSSFICSQC